MDKRTAIEWLAGFVCAQEDEMTETAELLSADVDIPLADATKYVIECESLLKELFNDWLANTPEEEDTAAPTAVEGPTVEASKETANKLNTDINPDA